ncbi:imidazole glycerol phosphate synthase subunit HisH [Amorphus orientalis]|uniref:Imidazole glycerol phosphate synthase subunit HisH n=1 Tax=Amorphus orientalis TaxID=649198 RepID=A0AAE3VR63_9HYPH|nr:imidazole glycerol phosphate synthase subunit HisH [Amorphus orientalis]MDQ0316685.1 glutamine amidotransferase [Amorphus orientalis]
MNNVVIVDYGSGNLRSAAKAVERAATEASVEIDLKVTAAIDRVLEADRLILPGVGAFADCRRGLETEPDMIEAIRSVVEERAAPFLGICVGMQLMADRGLEYEITPGFGWIHGDVTRITPADPTLKIPHMGWNTLDVTGQHPILEGIPTGPEGWHAYFVHSYHMSPADPDDLIATTDYAGPITAIVGRDNVVGTQFHPEKSEKLGIRLLSNFLRWDP